MLTNSLPKHLEKEALILTELGVEPYEIEYLIYKKIRREAAHKYLR